MPETITHDVVVTRKVMICRGEDTWINISFTSLHEGDKFELFDPDGTSIGRYIATSPPYEAASAKLITWGINARPLIEDQPPAHLRESLLSV